MFHEDHSLMVRYILLRGVFRIDASSLLVGAALILFVIASSGCAVTVRTSPAAQDDGLARCEHLFETLDNAVEAAGVRDGGTAPVKGFPYLRVNRFLASYRWQVLTPQALSWWVEQMRRLDQEARAIELANLPSAYGRGLPAELRDPESRVDRLEKCAGKLARRDLADSSRQIRLHVAAEVPDDYQTWKRALGLYPLTAFAFCQGILKYQSNTRQTLATPLQRLSLTGHLVAYLPKAASPQPMVLRRTDLERDDDNPLGVPIPESRALNRLVAANAPVLEVDEKDRNDRIGAPVLTRRGAANIDTSNPTAFVRVAYARYAGQPLLQLVYSFWFPARPKTSRLDLLGGHLDGLIWRVTLDAEGNPLLYDTIHSCGCYHMFFPTPRARLRPRERAFEEPILAPARLGRRPPGEHVLIRITSGAHSIENVRYGTGSDIDGQRTYTFADDDRLRSLPWPGNGRRSLYRPDGIVPGTERAERFLYWPMGVREPGSMRQWGRHATAFVGRRQFDDPALIERYFELSPGRAP